MNDDLCIKCRRLFAGIKKTGRNEIVTFGTNVELIESAQQGCRFCCIVANAPEFLDLGLSSDPETCIPLLAQYTFYEEVGLSFKLLHGAKQGKPGLAAISLYRNGPKSESSRILSHMNFKSNARLLVKATMCSLRSQSLDSEETWQRIAQWIKSCLADHRSCNMPIRQVHYPRRLIFVTSISPPAVQLCDTNNWTQRPLYAALSHCWGGQTPLMSTNTNVEELMRHIPFAQLPKTFREAIHLVHKIGLQYLWIDSLCIIQDSIRDWETECIKMLSIYQGSCLTIAAAAAASPEGGLFASRNPRAIVPCTVELGEGHASSEVTTDYTGVSAFRELPLASRGWVLHETILSHRVLSFAANEVFWECGALFASETFPEGFDIQEGDGAPRDDRFQRLRMHMNDGLPVNDSALWRVWNDIIAEYTTRRLTRAADKFVAISGLATRFEQAWSGGNVRYLAGLWSRWLRQGLLWRVANTRKSPRPYVATAPSWSWASIDGEVYPYAGTLQHGVGLAEIIAASAEEWNDGSLRTPVMRGSIQICGLVGPFEIRSASGINGNYNVYLYDSPDENSEGEVPGFVSAKVYFDHSEFSQISGGTFVLLPLEVQKNSYKNQVALRGLVLNQTYQKKGQYTRIGYFEITEKLASDSSRAKSPTVETDSPASSHRGSISYVDDIDPYYLTTVDVLVALKSMGIRLGPAISAGDDQDHWDPNEPFDNDRVDINGHLRDLAGCPHIQFFLASIIAFNERGFGSSEAFEESKDDGYGVISIV